MLRESHRRRGRYRASRGSWSHRGVYVGAVVATAALVAGFGAAVVIYGPIGGLTFRQTGSTTPGVPPKGVVFGQGKMIVASELGLRDATNHNATWQWTDPVTQAFTGPCNASGILNQSDATYVYYDTNSTPQNLSGNGSSVTLVCLNSVGPSILWPYGGVLNATWYALPGASYPTYPGLPEETTFNSYDLTNFVANGSYDNDTLANISSCNQWQYTAQGFVGPVWNQTHAFNASFEPCTTYYEMNDNTSWMTSFAGYFTGSFFLSGPYMGFPIYNAPTLWAPDEFGYGPNDIVYEVPVLFTNQALNGTYAITVSIQGATPVAQTFYFNNTIGGVPTAQPDTVLFTFDMTAAWAMDLTLNQTNMTTPATVNGPLFYGAIGVVSSVVTQCIGPDVYGTQVCPDPWNKA